MKTMLFIGDYSIPDARVIIVYKRRAITHESATICCILEYVARCIPDPAHLLNFKLILLTVSPTLFKGRLVDTRDNTAPIKSD